MDLRLVVTRALPRPCNNVGEAMLLGVPLVPKQILGIRIKHNSTSTSLNYYSLVSARAGSIKSPSRQQNRPTLGGDKNKATTKGPLGNSTSPSTSTSTSF